MRFHTGLNRETSKEIVKVFTENVNQNQSSFSLIERWQENSIYLLLPLIDRK
jgi:hypothetical protein